MQAHTWKLVTLASGLLFGACSSPNDTPGSALGVRLTATAFPEVIPLSGGGDADQPLQSCATICQTLTGCLEDVCDLTLSESERAAVSSTCADRCGGANEEAVRAAQALGDDECMGLSSRAAETGLCAARPSLADCRTACGASLACQPDIAESMTPQQCAGQCVQSTQTDVIACVIEHAGDCDGMREACSNEEEDPDEGPPFSTQSAERCDAYCGWVTRCWPGENCSDACLSGRVPPESVQCIVDHPETGCAETCE
jgi:hypothetical protein